MIRRFWPVLAAGCILTMAAFAHGWRTDRWGAPPKLSEAAAQLDALPLRIGDWEGAVLELPAEQVRIANVAALSARKYTHRYTHAEVTVLILCGRPGPVSVHTPDVCYQGAGYVMGPSRTEALTEGNNARVADFKKAGPLPATLRIRWAWSKGGEWMAVESPRLQFAREQILYKMYMVRQVPSGGDSSDSIPEIILANELLPLLQTSLVPLQ
jgi:hypothetical protein